MILRGRPGRGSRKAPAVMLMSVLAACGIEPSASPSEPGSGTPAETQTEAFSRADVEDVFGRGGMTAVDSVLLKRMDWRQFLDGGGRSFLATSAGTGELASKDQADPGGDRMVADYETPVYVVHSRGVFRPVAPGGDAFTSRWRLVVVDPARPVALVSVYSPESGSPEFLDRLPDHP